MFFGVYEASDRALRFANCCYVPPMILHADATIERLASTTAVLGLFLNWDCPIEEAKLRPRDLLIICADGVTEAPNASHEEYGEARLVKVVQENRSRPVRRQVPTDRHAPGRYRAATVRNIDGWYSAFDVQPGRTMYLAPPARVRIW